MRTRNKTSEWTFRITFSVLVLFALLASLAVNTTGLAGGNDLGTSPFDFTDAVYRAHGILPGTTLLRVGDASRTGDFVVDNTNTDRNGGNSVSVLGKEGTVVSTLKVGAHPGVR